MTEALAHSLIALVTFGLLIAMVDAMAINPNQTTNLSDTMDR